MNEKPIKIIEHKMNYEDHPWPDIAGITDTPTMLDFWTREAGDGDDWIKMSASLYGSSVMEFCVVKFAQRYGDEERRFEWKLPMLPSSRYPDWLEREWLSLWTNWRQQRGIDEIS